MKRGFIALDQHLHNSASKNKCAEMLRVDREAQGEDHSMLQL